MGGFGSKKTILHIIPSLMMGGAEKLLLDTIKLLPEYKHHIVTFEIDLEFAGRLESFATIHLRRSARVFTPSNVVFLRRVKNRIKPSIIHAHLLKANWLSRVVFPFSKSLFNSIHSPYSKDAFCHNRYALVIEKLTFHLSNVRLIFVSDYVKADYEKYIDVRTRGYVLLNFVEEQYFQKAARKYMPKQPLHLVAVGNIKSIKNYDLLIAAFRELTEFPIFLNVYGKGAKLEELKKKARGLNVNFLGHVNETSEVLPDHHAFLFASFYEGFSIALLEAMAARLPLIVSNIPMFRTLTCGKAYFFEPDNVKQAVDAIKRAFEEGFDYNLVQENFEYVQINFTPSTFQSRLKEIYN